jgi:hypothetical protein
MVHAVLCEDVTQLLQIEVGQPLSQARFAMIAEYRERVEHARSAASASPSWTRVLPI